MSGVTIQCDKCYRDWITYGDCECPWCKLDEARALLREMIDLIDAEDLNRSAFTKWAKRAAAAGGDHAQQPQT
jgi:hypothetical protein